MPLLARRIFLGSVLCLSPLVATFVWAAPQKTPFKNGPGVLPGGTTTQLHNGWRISPVGTQHESLGDLLLGGVVSPDGKWLAFVNGGRAAHKVHIANTASGKVVTSLAIERAQSSGGVAFSPDNTKLYVSGANAGQVYVFTVGAEGTLTVQPPLVLTQLQSVLPRKAEPGKAKPGETDPEKADPGEDAGRDPFRQDAPEENAYLGGLTLSPDGATLYIANLAGDSVFALDATTGASRAQCKLGSLDRPSAVAMAPDGKTLYVALWGGAKVLGLDPVTLATRATLRTGNHPNALVLTGDGTRLFVSCGNDDSVYSFDTAAKLVREKVNMRLTPRAPAGATPSALALSPDEKTLYVVNSDNNDVACVDVSVPNHSRVEGFIPTAWYPTFVATSRDGKRLFIGNGKGYLLGPNDKQRPIDPVVGRPYPYLINLLRGVLSTVNVPDAKQLTAYTRQVYANSPYSDALLDKPAGAPKPGRNPIPSGPKGRSPIKHVLYIIKENRTYDQVLGDLKDAKGKRIGNGDPTLTLFDEQVTPNHHALAREFVTLDNLYANGEVSADGHHWSNAAYVPDAMQRTWPSQYGNKGNAPIRAGDVGDPLSETPSGRIWDVCERANLTYRSYYGQGEKRRSAEWFTGPGRDRDSTRVDLYINEVAQWEKTGAMPRFMIMGLGEDHTKGTTPGAFTPKASVASNDLAIGKLVAACSKSRFWKNMAIFIIEDDAQNGPDHVDAHRTVALVASPYTRRHVVDSTFYSTCSLLRTMELILGLPPMSQYDAAATPLYNSFTSKPNFTPYTVRPARIDLNARNLKLAYGAKASLAMDFSGYDHLTVQDEDTLNRVLWHSIKGTKTLYPGIVRRPLFNLQGRPVTTSPHRKPDDDDDDDD